MSDFLTCRSAVWHFVRRVPAEFAALDRRVIIRHSTRIHMKRWNFTGSRLLRIGQAQTRLAMTKLAAVRALGYDYIPNNALVALPIERLLERLEALVAKGLTQDAGARTALLGTGKPIAFPQQSRSG